MKDTDKLSKPDIIDGVSVTPVVVSPDQKLLIHIKNEISPAALTELAQAVEKFMKTDDWKSIILRGEAEFFLLEKDAEVEIKSEATT